MARHIHGVEEEPADASAEQAVRELDSLARELRSLKTLSGRTYRDLGARANYSHVHLARAAGGKSLPSWTVTEAFIKACGVTDNRALNEWKLLWERTRRVVQPERQDSAARSRELINDPTGVGRLAGADGRATRSRSRNGSTSLQTDGPAPPAGPSIFGTFDDLSYVTTREDFGQALRQLSARAGCRTVRDVERRTIERSDYDFISRSTLSEWFRGQRLPSLSKLVVLLTMLEANYEEQIEFAHCLGRLDKRSALR